MKRGRNSHVQIEIQAEQGLDHWVTLFGESLQSEI